MATLQPPKMKSTPLERALKAENLKLQTKMANLQAQVVTLKNRNSVLEKQAKARPGTART